MKLDCIVLCEPQCWGFEHVSVNSALLETALLAYPDALVVFLGEKEHVELVRQEVKESDEAAEERVEWQETSIPARTLGGVRRLTPEWHLCRAVLKEASARSAGALVMCSITSTGLLVLNCLLYLSRFQMPVLVIPHGILASVANRQPRAPWNRALGFRQIIRLPKRRELGYLVLGEPLLQSLREEQPKAARNFQSLDHPYRMSGREPDTGFNATDKVRFGFLGAGTEEKSFDRFARLVEKVKARCSDAQFILAGFLREEDASAPGSGLIEGVGYQPLSRQEYENRVSSLTYVVWTSQPAHYQLVASGTFMDALAFCKPGIYLRNSYLEHYFDRLGDIGYLCDSEKDLESVVLSIASEFPKERYARQQENIRRGRSVFEPVTLAPRFREIVDSATV